MQSEISEEVDMGKALLRTRREAALQSLSECTQKKVSAFRCINLSDLEVRGREEMMGGVMILRGILFYGEKKVQNVLHVQTKMKSK